MLLHPTIPTFNEGFTASALQSTASGSLSLYAYRYILDENMFSWLVYGIRFMDHVSPTTANFRCVPFSQRLVVLSID